MITYLDCVPNTKPEVRTYVRKAISGIYRSGALMSSLADTGPLSCENFGAQSFNKYYIYPGK